MPRKREFTRAEERVLAAIRGESTVAAVAARAGVDPDTVLWHVRGKDRRAGGRRSLEARGAVGVRLGVAPGGSRGGNAAGILLVQNEQLRRRGGQSNP